MAPTPELDSAPPFNRLELHDLFNIAHWQEQLPWKPFHDGADIYRLYGDGVIGPSAALIRFRAGGKVPLHTHAGYEHILILHGGQRDQNKPVGTGTLMINAPGTTHSVVSDSGCIVLAIYEKPGQFAMDVPLDFEARESAAKPGPSSYDPR